MKWRDLPGNKTLDVITVIEDSQLPEGLIKVALGILRKNPDYHNVKIVPGDIATEETKFEFAKPVHVVYGKIKKKKDVAYLIFSDHLKFRDRHDVYLGPANHVL